MKKTLTLFLLAFLSPAKAQLPPHFVYLKDVAPTIEQDIRYFTSNNFVGHPITGYEKPTCILTANAAIALAKVEKSLNKVGLGIKVFDCYRPRVAVDEFVAWSYDFNDQKMKQEYYPRIDKSQLFALNYISNQSGHTRGSTVDLTIINLLTNKELNMGTHFDFLDPRSNSFSNEITAMQFKNRLLLRSVMQKYGFLGIKTEWWHFTLKNEPYPDSYFNFSVN